MSTLLGSATLAGAVRVTDEYYRHLFEHAGVAMVSSDQDLRIRTWNAAAAQMFGAAVGSVLGTPVVSIIPLEGRETAERLIRQAGVSRDITHFEFQHRDSQGQPRTLAVTVSPVVGDAGACSGALCCFRDITTRINLAAELAHRNKMASLGEMAGGLAHYFNNILGGAVTSVDFALASDDPLLHAKTLQKTGQALTRATKLLKALLCFAEGDQRDDAQGQLIDVILQVAKEFERGFTAADVRLDLRVSTTPRLSVPKTQLATVLENVFQNAVDAMPHGGTLTLHTSPVTAGCVLTVSDTGCGMSEQALQKLFQPFFSTKRRDAEDEGHPGLGLAVAHGILSVLGHSISVSSTPGQGTTVVIDLRNYSEFPERSA